MKNILSLDISSSTIGWSLFRINDNKIILDKFGHIKPPSKAAAEKKSLGLSYRLSEISKSAKELLKKTDPDTVVVEDYAKRFSRGRSSANTIIILATVNEVISLECFNKLGKEVFRMPVSRIRKILKDKYKEQSLDKDENLLLMNGLFGSFSTKLNRAGNIKKECYDEADALAAGLAFCIDRLKDKELYICQK